MAKFLSDEWIEAVRASAADVTAGDISVRLEVSAGDTQFHAVIVDGAVESVAAGGLSDADVSLTLPIDEATAVAQGELAPSVAFMQGRMKTAGDPGKLLDLLALTARPGFAQFRESVAATTDF